MENQGMDENQKYFDLGAILNITTRRLFTSMDDIHDILSYLTGNKLYTHQLPRAEDFAQPYILSLYPELKGVGVDVEIHSAEDAKAFVDEQKKIFGEKLPLRPMPKSNGYSYVDPIEEAVEMTSGKK
ncbi:MAG: hypothetical protein J6X02_04865 [Bacilli bacterium]|nr:hypothetical protein [Bacilli bacterium]